MITGDEITEETQDAIASQLSFFNTFLLVFAVIAVLVGAFVIYNTFSIIVAQRSRELALLRAIGRLAPPGDQLGAGRGRLRRPRRLDARARRRHRPRQRACARCLNGFGFDMPDGSLVIAAGDDRRRARPRASSSPRSPRCSRRSGRRGSRRSPPCATWRHDTSGQSRVRILAGLLITIVGGPAAGPGPVRRGRQRPARRSGVGAGLVFLGVTVLGPILVGPFVARHRLADRPLPGHHRPPGPGEHRAQPQAHLVHRRRPDDRRRPGRAHHHRRGLGDRASINQAIDESFTG